MENRVCVVTNYFTDLADVLDPCVDDRDSRVVGGPINLYVDVGARVLVQPMKILH